jgi:uncharacterized membrane protein YgaE (UPF0421/DUF939 family)
MNPRQIGPTSNTKMDSDREKEIWDEARLQWKIDDMRRKELVAENEKANATYKQLRDKEAALQRKETAKQQKARLKAAIRLSKYAPFRQESKATQQRAIAEIFATKNNLICSKSELEEIANMATAFIANPKLLPKPKPKPNNEP